MELTITAAALLLVTVAASIIFYRKIKEATIEYDGAKEFVHNITFGFTRQVNRLQQDIAKAENEATTAKIVASEALRNSGEAKEATLKGLEAVKSHPEPRRLHRVRGRVHQEGGPKARLSTEAARSRPPGHSSTNPRPAGQHPRAAHRDRAERPQEDR